MKLPVPRDYAVIFLLACQSTALTAQTETPAGMQLTTQSDTSPLNGKMLTLGPSQSFTVADDGKLTGTWDGNPPDGTDKTMDGYFCRTLSQGSRGLAPEDCQLLVLHGSNLEVTQGRGTGNSFTYMVS